MSEEVKYIPGRCMDRRHGWGGEEVKESRKQDARIKALADETEELEHIGSHL